MSEHTKSLYDRLKDVQLGLIRDGFQSHLLSPNGLYCTYMKLFDRIPHEINLYFEGSYLNPKADQDDEEDVDEFDDNDNVKHSHTSIYKYKCIDVTSTYINIINKFPDAVVIRNSEHPIVIMENAIIFNDKFDSQFIVLQDTADWNASPLCDCVVDKADNDSKRYFDYVTYGKSGFDTVDLELKNPNIDLENNYNDDIPDKEIREFITSNDSGLAILHGVPGTGKSTYIKNLIWEFKNKDFILLDSSVFDYITDSSFISLLSDCKNSVIILEDCESMLTNREMGNGKLSALLNLSDGIIGDAFNFKFICTFNAEIGKIDKALLRKGRMKIKYEFKKLTAAKTKKLAEKLGHEIQEGESLSLADIYNYGLDNNAGTERSVGFKG